MTDEERWRELEREAEERGLVPVIVTLEVEWEPEGDLPPQQRAVQQRRIAEARQALLRELEGTSVENVRGYAAVPQVTMSVGPDAIMALRRSPHVQAVVEDVPAPLEP